MPCQAWPARPKIDRGKERHAETEVTALWCEVKGGSRKRKGVRAA
jgi:hypothetical protein